MKKQTVYTLLLIALVLAFFIPPVSDYSKIQLNRIFDSAPTIIDAEKGGKITSYNWKLKDANWEYFNFDRSKGKVVFINFWASWHLPSRAQFKDIEQLYNRHKGEVEFYFITNEERPPVEEFLLKNKYDLPITYQIIGEPSPIQIMEPPGSYVLDKNGFIRIHQTDISDWNNTKVNELFTALLAEE